MALKLLHESTTAPLERKGSRWKAVLITPGAGSSANYSEAALEASVGAFVSGTKNFFMHPESASTQRDPRDQWGFIPEAVSYEPGVGIVAEIEVLPHWKEVVDSLAEAGQAALSIWAMGETDEDGNLVSLTEDSQNTVDLISFPGRPGSGLTTKMYESARAAYVPTHSDAASAQENKEEVMDKEILEAVKALALSFGNFVSETKALAAASAVAEADADANEKAVESAVASYAEKVVAVEAAKLFPSQAAAILVEAAKGKDVAKLIEDAKTIFAEATASVKLNESAGGRSLGSNAAEDFTIEGWGK